MKYRYNLSLKLSIHNLRTTTALVFANAAFVLDGFTAPIQQAYLKASDTEINAIFGSSVAASGDTLVVGSPSQTSLPGYGAAYVFVKNGTNWVQQAQLKPSNMTGNFGTSVS